MAELDTTPIDWIVDAFNNFLGMFQGMFNGWFAWLIVGVILFLVAGIFIFIFKMAVAGLMR